MAIVLVKLESSASCMDKFCLFTFTFFNNAKFKAMPNVLFLLAVPCKV